jgi:sugar-specific transcriptional regulator TrmB
MSQPDQSLEKADEPLQDVMGWGSYHAAAYRCLVDEGPLEASEVVVRTDVPRGRIYDVLEDLVEEGVVTYREGNPSEYGAQNPERLLQDRKEEFDEKATGLIETLGNAYQLNLPEESSSSAWILGSRAGTVRKLREILEEATESVHALEPDPRWYETSDCRTLEELNRNNVDIKFIVWNARQEKLNDFVSFNFPVWEHENVNKMVYIIDEQQVVFRIDGGDTGIIFSDKSMASIFIDEFETTFKEAERFDTDA